MKRTYLAVVIAVLAFNGCIEKKQLQLSEEKLIADTSYSTLCPYLTKDNKGQLVMSWVKETNDTDAVLCYSIFDEASNSFETTYTVTPSMGLHPHGENLPKIAFKHDGTVVAMWGLRNPNPNNKYSGLVSYAFSKNGKDWSDAIPLVADTSSYDQRYFDLLTMRNGTVTAVWLDSRLKGDEEGSTLFTAQLNGDNQFGDEQAIAESCCPCCRTELFTDKKGDVHVAFRDIIHDNIRDMVHIKSGDGGKTFSSPVRISADNWEINGCPHTGPTMTENNEGLHFAWYTMGGGSGVYYSRSEDGNIFAPRDSVSTSPSAKHPQIITGSNQNIFIAWDEVMSGTDKNVIMLQQRSPEGKKVSNYVISEQPGAATFPVLLEGKDKRVVVVYTVQRGDKRSVYYRQMWQ